MRSIWIKTAVLSILLISCSYGDDLPDGWENAVKVDGVTQSECQDSAYDENVIDTFSGVVNGNSIDLMYTNAHFRCSQDIEVFQIKEEDIYKFLIQPADMNPSAVAKCDCLYDISWKTEDITTDSYVFTLHTRGDHKSGRDTPKEIATVELSNTVAIE